MLTHLNAAHDFNASYPDKSHIDEGCPFLKNNYTKDRRPEVSLRIFKRVNFALNSQLGFVTFLNICHDRSAESDILHVQMATMIMSSSSLTGMDLSAQQ